MSQPSKTLVVLAGSASLFVAFVMLAMSGLMYALETPLETCLIFGLLSIIPLLVTVACFAPRYRSIALRILGACAFVACCGTLIQNVISRINGEPTHGGRLGPLIVATIGTGIMAWKGKWPGADREREEPPPSTTDAGG